MIPMLQLKHRLTRDGWLAQGTAVLASLEAEASTGTQRHMTSEASLQPARPAMHSRGKEPGQEGVQP